MAKRTNDGNKREEDRDGLGVSRKEEVLLPESSDKQNRQVQYQLAGCLDKTLLNKI